MNSFRKKLKRKEQKEHFIIFTLLQNQVCNLALTVPYDPTPTCLIFIYFIPSFMFQLN
jgi:hypothetical protein